MSLKIIYSDEYLKYFFGSSHPVLADKTTQFLKTLRESQIDFEILSPPEVTDQDILLAHTEKYLKEVKYLAQEGLNLAPDTPLTLEILTASYFVTGGTVLCARLALKNEKAINLIGGMHHASSYTSSGFCVFNDPAVAIKKLQQEKLIEKAAVIDLDVHAGQGTQEIFYKDPSVLTVSVHQDPMTIYPGVGFEMEIGEKEGIGYSVNLVLPPGTKEDKYLETVDQAIEKVDQFNPDLTILVLGVDTYEHDLLGKMSLKKESYTKIGQRFKNKDHLAVLFAGGYSPETPSLWIDFLKGYLF